MAKRPFLWTIATIGAGASAGIALWARRTLAELASRKGSGVWETELSGEQFEVSTEDGALIKGRILGGLKDRTFVLSHCWGGDMRVWLPVAQRLVQAGSGVVLYDQRGHGTSSLGPDEVFPLERLGHDLALVIRTLELRDPIVVGHSMGGIAVQLMLAEEGAPSVKAAGLVATTHKVASRSAGVLSVAPFFVSNPGTDILLSVKPLAALVIRPVMGRNPALQDLVLVADTFRRADRRARAGFIEGFRQLDLSAELPRVKARALVVVGSEDRLTPPKAAARLANLLPEAELRIIEGAGHMLPLEEPEALAALLLDL
jgi:pimeloyl-ACP methyl ester carboxylesterase